MQPSLVVGNASHKKRGEGQRDSEGDTARKVIDRSRLRRPEDRDTNLFQNQLRPRNRWSGTQTKDNLLTSLGSFPSILEAGICEGRILITIVVHILSVERAEGLKSVDESGDTGCTISVPL